MKTAVIIAPFWRQPGHVGNHRVDRFVRWLAEDGYHVILVRGGSVDGNRQEPWGLELTVRDPIGLYRDPAPGVSPASLRKPNQLRRSLAYWIFNPDPGVAWARKVCVQPEVLQHAAGTKFILSSSPPESAHVAAGKLSHRIGVPHVVDMRDGWLDEPIKPILRESRIRRWFEGRLEQHLLAHAGLILVTSDVWRDLLSQRMPDLASKVAVLTNAYPLASGRSASQPLAQVCGAERPLELMHAGQFSGSDPSRVPDLLLQPLLDGIRQIARRGVIRLVGEVRQTDRDRIKRFEPAFHHAGWTIECKPPMPRLELLDALESSDGLLLLSASKAAIPSKLFEYISAKRPILAVTERDSATWRICGRASLAFRVEIGNRGDAAEVAAFLRVASGGARAADCPEEFSESSLHARFGRATRALWGDAC